MTGYLTRLDIYRQMEVFDETATIDKLKRDLCYVAQDFDSELKSATARRRSTAPLLHVCAEFVLPDYHYRRGLRANGYEASCLQPGGKKATNKAGHDATVLAGRVGAVLRAGVAFCTAGHGLKQCGLTELSRTRSSSVRTRCVRIYPPKSCLWEAARRCPGLRERLQRELRPLMLEPYDVEVVAPRELELTVFQGAAMLARHEDQYLEARLGGARS